MNHTKNIGLVLSTILLAGCHSVGIGKLPKTLGERASDFGYVPLDPLPISTAAESNSCKEHGKKNMLPIAEALPDLTSRFAIAQVTGGGELAFGPVKTTQKGSFYKAILDSTFADSVSVTMLISQRVKKGSNYTWRNLEYYPESGGKVGEGDQVVAYRALIVPDQKSITTKQKFQYNSDKAEEILREMNNSTSESSAGNNSSEWSEVSFPVYLGLAFRLTADFKSLESNVNIGSLSAIGVTADANGLAGSMTLQAIGVNGLPVVSALVLPNKIDQTTIQQSVLAIGAGRALIYTDTAENKVSLNPRVIGLYSPIGTDARLINAVYSELSKVRINWRRPCKAK